MVGRPDPKVLHVGIDKYYAQSVCDKHWDAAVFEDNMLARPTWKTEDEWAWQCA